MLLVCLVLSFFGRFCFDWRLELDRSFCHSDTLFHLFLLDLHHWVLQLQSQVNCCLNPHPLTHPLIPSSLITDTTGIHNRSSLFPLLPLPRLFLSSLRGISSYSFYWWIRDLVGGGEVDVYGWVFGVGECDDCEFFFPF